MPNLHTNENDTTQHKAEKRRTQTEQYNGKQKPPTMTVLSFTFGSECVGLLYLGICISSSLTCPTPDFWQVIVPERTTGCQRTSGQFLDLIVRAENIVDGILLGEVWPILAVLSGISAIQGILYKAFVMGLEWKTWLSLP